MIIGLVSIILAAVPTAFILWLFVRRDRERPEPKGLLFNTFFWGVLSIIPAAAIEGIIGRFTGNITGVWYHLARAFIVAALVEESVKLAVVKRFVLDKPAFNEMTDGIIYLIAASMGFAFFENIVYGFGDPGIMLLRAFTAVPLHAAAAGIMGYYVAKSKVGNEPSTGKGLFYAILVHGLYNFFLFTGTWLAVLVIPLLVMAYIILIRLWKRARAEDEAAGRFRPPSE